MTESYPTGKIYRMPRPYRICKRCVMDTSDPELTFDDDGVCFRCHSYDSVIKDYVFHGEEGKRRLDEIVHQIKEEGKGKRYDCIIGLSGGVDSTYVAYLVKQAGLRPLAIHLDNGWNSETAVGNIERVVKILGIDLYTEVLDWDEFRSLQLALLRASTPDSEIPTDHAIVTTLYRQAIKHGVRFIIGGSNFATEQMIPRIWSHGHDDWRYIRTVNQMFGAKKLRTFPHYTYFEKKYYFPYIKRIQVILILNYREFDKFKAIELMKRDLGWVPYGGKHHESIYTRFYQSYILPKKFGGDKRRPHLSCLINDHRISRDQALAELQQLPADEEIIEQDRQFVIKKLGITEAEFEEIMQAEPKTTWEYPTDELSPPKYDVLVSRVFNFVKRASQHGPPTIWDLVRGLAHEIRRSAGEAFVRVSRINKLRQLCGKMIAIARFLPGLARVLVRKMIAIAFGFLPGLARVLGRNIEGGLYLVSRTRVVVGRLQFTVRRPNPWTVVQRERIGLARNVLILAPMTAGSDEPRVRRQCGALVDRGYTTTVIGFPGRSTVPDSWHLIEIDAQQMGNSQPFIMPWFGAMTNVAFGYYWEQSRYRYIYELVKGFSYDFVIAHDYFMAPIAERIAAEQNIPFSVDVHEYARGQFSFANDVARRVRWNLVQRPYIDALSRYTYRKAALVTTVCDGIADLLQSDYGLVVRPTVVRGTPVYESMPFNRTGQVIRILYHGLLVPTRGLEQAIASIKLCRPEFRLVIRGMGQPEYVALLRNLAEREGVGDRVQFEPPVPFTGLVAAANVCDVGFVVLENYSPQREFTLPNKFFEYIMAGLTLCVSDLPEMAKIMRRYNLGPLVVGTEPRSIASAINGLTREQIDACKQRSLAAARELCWERESTVFIRALQDSIPAFAQSAAGAESVAGHLEKPRVATA